MKVSFFIDRPVFSAVISIVIVIVGIIGLTMLPVDQYPQITPPVPQVALTGAERLDLSVQRQPVVSVTAGQRTGGASPF